MTRFAFEEDYSVWGMHLEGVRTEIKIKMEHSR